LIIISDNAILFPERNVPFKEGDKMKLGWRKLTAWALVYVFIVTATFIAKDIGDNAVELMKWVTGFFFGANALEHFAGKIGVNVKPKAQ
jgi:hypothetical protein